MTTHRILRATRLAFAAAALVAIGGCVLSVESDTRYRHGSLSRSVDLVGLRVGETSRDWVVENLGTPPSAYLNEAGNEVLVYQSIRETDTEVMLLLLFAFDVSEEEIHTLNVEIGDDVVRSYWFD